MEVEQHSLAFFPDSLERRIELRATITPLGVKHFASYALRMYANQYRVSRLNISQDESKRAQDQLQKMTDLYIGQMDGLGLEKEKEVMEI